MPGPDAAFLLAAWEQAATLAPAARALYLAQLAAPDDLADASVLARDRRLAALRIRWFGRRVDLVARCPSCGTAFDLEVDLAALAAAAAADPEHIQVADGAGGVSMRLPTADDLIAVAPVGSRDAFATALFARCTPAADGSATLRAAAADRLLALARDAGQAIELACGACGTAWSEYLDVAFVLWREIEASAHRLGDEVTRLAAAYRWSEADILALSAPRRRLYLDAIG